MAELKKKNLAFFLTLGLSLEKWAAVGILTREVSLYNLLARQFHKIYFFTYGNKKELKYQKYLAPNIKIIFKKSRLPSLFYSFLLPLYHYRVLQSCSFFKSNQHLGAWGAYLAKLLANPKGKFILRTGFIWSLFLKNENRFFYFLARILESWLYRFCNLALVSSKADKKYLQKKYHLPSSKIKVLANYVDTNLFKPDPKVPKLKGKIIFVGRLHPQKNLPNLIKALRNTDIELDIIGQGKLKEKLERYAKNCRVKVNFLGNLPHQNLPRFLNRYRTFVLPSFYEGLPKSLAEAMACGLACLGTRVAGIKEIIKHKNNGYLVEPDAKSIQQGLQYLMKNEGLRNKLGNNARQTILERFTLKDVALQEIRIYKYLLKK